MSVTLSAQISLTNFGISSALEPVRGTQSSSPPMRHLLGFHFACKFVFWVFSHLRGQREREREIPRQSAIPARQLLCLLAACSCLF